MRLTYSFLVYCVILSRVAFAITLFYRDCLAPVRSPRASLVVSSLWGILDVTWAQGTVDTDT